MFELPALQGVENDAIPDVHAVGGGKGEKDDQQKGGAEQPRDQRLAAPPEAAGETPEATQGMGRLLIFRSSGNRTRSGSLDAFAAVNRCPLRRAVAALGCGMRRGLGHVVHRRTPSVS